MVGDVNRRVLARYGSDRKLSENFSLLRKWVIEPAVKELTEKDNWLIEWEAIKRGRKVTALRFQFERNPQGGLF